MLLVILISSKSNNKYDDGDGIYERPININIIIREIFLILNYFHNVNSQ